MRERYVMLPRHHRCLDWLPRVAIVLLACLLYAVPSASRQQAQPSPEFSPAQLDFFERKIRPALVQHCYSCHTGDPKKLKGGLSVETRQSLLDGGDNGPAIVPGDPDKSLLIKAI